METRGLMMTSSLAVEYTDANGWVHSVIVHSLPTAVECKQDLEAQGHEVQIVQCEYRRRTVVAQ